MAAVKKVGQKNGEVGLLVEYLLCDVATIWKGESLGACPPGKF